MSFQVVGVAREMPDPSICRAKRPSDHQKARGRDPASQHPHGDSRPECFDGYHQPGEERDGDEQRAKLRLVGLKRSVHGHRFALVQDECGIHQSKVAERLREVPELAPTLRVVFFGEQSEIVPSRSRSLE